MASIENENVEYTVQEQALQRANLIIMKRQKHDNPLLDRKANSHLYECCVMHELGVFMYRDVPPRLFRNAPEEFKKYSLRDMGIDGISGDYKIAVQAKFNSPGNDVSWTAVSTFDNFCETLGTVERRIIATPENVTILGPKENLRNEHIIVSDATFLEFYDRASKFNKRPPKNINNIPLYEWQGKAILDLSERLSNINVAAADPTSNQVKLCASCASGKTRVVAELIKRGNLFPCIVFASSVLLVDQLLAEIKKWISPNVKITSTLDSREHADIYVAPYSGNKKVAKMIENSGDGFKLCVIDEAHHVEEVFNGKNPSTATVASKNMLNEIKKQRTLLISANLRDVSCGFTYGLHQAIFDETVVDFNVILYEGKNLADFIKNETNMPRIIAYCNGAGDVKLFSDALTAADVLHGVVETKTSKREAMEIEQQLEDGKIRVLITSRLYNEGTNVPFVDTCLFVGPIARKKINQCIGRVLRNYPGKTFASVVFTTMDKSSVLELKAIDDRFSDLSTVADVRTSTNPRICYISE